MAMITMMSIFWMFSVFLDVEFRIQEFSQCEKVSDNDGDDNHVLSKRWVAWSKSWGNLLCSGRLPGSEFRSLLLVLELLNSFLAGEKSWQCPLLAAGEGGVERGGDQVDGGEDIGDEDRDDDCDEDIADEDRDEDCDEDIGDEDGDEDCDEDRDEDCDENKQLYVVFREIQNILYTYPFIFYDIG